MAKYSLWLCLALFSLTPCTVKETLFGWVDIAYAKPSNKSKTVAPASVCAYLPSGEQQASTTKQSESTPALEPAVAVYPQFSDVPTTPIHSRYAKTSSGNSPPKYILYKRLKIGIA